MFIVCPAGSARQMSRSPLLCRLLQVGVYLNRLSDYLFTAARFAVSILASGLEDATRWLLCVLLPCRPPTRSNLQSKTARCGCTVVLSLSHRHGACDQLQDTMDSHSIRALSIVPARFDLLLGT